MTLEQSTPTSLEHSCSAAEPVRRRAARPGSAQLTLTWVSRRGSSQVLVCPQQQESSRSSWISVTLGKATHLRPPRFPPSSPSAPRWPSPGKRASHCAIASVFGWRRFRFPGLPVMHIKTTKCNRFCLVASVTNQEVFLCHEARVSCKAGMQ